MTGSQYLLSRERDGRFKSNITGPCSQPFAFITIRRADMDVDPPAPTTPPRPAASNPRMPPDTPFKLRRADEPEFRVSNLESCRSAVIEDLGDIPIVSVETFMKNAFVQVITLRQVSEIRQHLKAKGILSSGDQWKGFAKEPSKMGVVETVAFKPLVAIYNAVSDAMTTKLGKGTATVLMGYEPGKTPLSERRNTSRPDGFLRLARGDPTLVHDEIKTKRKSWANIVAACEFKVHDLADVRTLSPYSLRFILLTSFI